MFNIINNKTLSLSVILTGSLLTGCNSSSDNSSEVVITATTAVVQTVSSDYSSSQVAYIDIATQDVNDGNHSKNASGYTISGDAETVYHIGQLNIDTIEKFSIDDNETSQWIYSTNNSTDSTSSNPYTFVPYTEDKAYIVSYGSDKIWIVNPQATTAEEFKIGELDLSAYNPVDSTPDDDSSDGNTVPSASDAIIVGNELFISMQRYTLAGNLETAYIAVFDAETDIEIDTNTSNNDNLKGIAITGLNPIKSSLTSDGDNVYVTTRNSYYADSEGLAYSSIEKINTSNYDLTTVLTAADIDNNTGGFLTMSTVVSDELGYFILNTYDANWNIDDQVYAFNPTTGVIAQDNITQYSEVGVSYIAHDDSNNLWVSVSDPSNPGLDVFDTTDNSLLYNRIVTILNPKKIIFVGNK